MFERLAAPLGQGGLRVFEGEGEGFEAEGVAKFTQGFVEDGFVFFGGEGAGGIDQHAAGPQALDGGEEQAALLAGHLFDLTWAPVGEGLRRVGAEAAFGGARRVEQHPVEVFGAVAPDFGAVLEEGADGGGPLRLEVGAQLEEAAFDHLYGGNLAGVLHPASQLQRLHAPVGLAIGSHTPAEIAISILAEITQLRNQTSGSMKATVNLV